MGAAVTVGADVLELFLIGLDAGLLEELSGDGLTAGLARLSGAAGILPGARKALALGPAGQQDIALAVVDPDTDDQAIFARTPPCPPAVDPPGEVSVFVIDVIELQAGHLLRSHMA